MILSDKPIEALVEQDFLNLVSTQASEGKRLEFKARLPGGSDGERKEFLADVSSFGNATGGDIVYGIDAPDGIAIGAAGIALGNVEAELLRLEGMIQAGVDPRIPNVTLRAIPLSSGYSVIIIRIPKSWAAPHMVTVLGSNRFYSRTSSGKFLLDVRELQ